MKTDAVGIGVDWGSTNIRAWALDAGGGVLAENAMAAGLADAASKGFENCLDGLLAPLGAYAGLPVAVCGMAGARGGWIETPYIPCPAAFDDILDAAAPAGRKGCFILPGVSALSPAPDVMRGEETQIIGAAAQGAGGLLCLPGTHSKWAQTAEDGVTAFQTHVSGELHALACRFGVFGALAREAPFQQTAFLEGVNSAETGALTNLLFQARSRVLLGRLTAEESYWFLSGVITGAEILNARHERAHVTLIADGVLAQIYAAAFAALDVPFTALSAGACVRRGLAAALTRAGETRRAS